MFSLISRKLAAVFLQIKFLKIQDGGQDGEHVAKRLHHKNLIIVTKSN